MQPIKITPLKIWIQENCREGLKMDVKQFLDNDNIVKFIPTPAGSLCLYKDTDVRKEPDSLFVTIDDGSLNPELAGTLWLLDDRYTSTSGQYTNVAENSKSKGMILFIDTETTGTPNNYDAPASDVNNWPRLVQLAFIKSDWEGNIVSSSDFIIKPQGFTISKEVSKLHGITHDMALSLGSNIHDVLIILNKEIEEAGLIAAHNMRFDEKIIAAEFHRNNIKSAILDKPKICTMKSSTEFCALPGGYNGYKWPKLSELHNKLFHEGFQEHNAKSDIFATYKCFWELTKRQIIKLNPDTKIVRTEENFRLDAEFDLSQLTQEELFEWYPEELYPYEKPIEFDLNELDIGFVETEQDRKKSKEYFGWAIVYYKQNRLEEALSSIELSIKESPPNEEVLWLKYQILKARHDYTNCIETLFLYLLTSEDRNRFINEYNEFVTNIKNNRSETLDKIQDINTITERWYKTMIKYRAFQWIFRELKPYYFTPNDFS
jgi:DNA polymerase III epsilon subunit-like protein